MSKVFLSTLMAIAIAVPAVAANSPDGDETDVVKKRPWIVAGLFDEDTGSGSGPFNPEINEGEEFAGEISIEGSTTTTSTGTSTSVTVVVKFQF